MERVSATSAHPPAMRGAAAGFVAGAVGLGISELLAGLVPGVPSLVTAMGSLVIALQPPGAKALVTGLFGTADKTALNVAVVVVALALAVLAGVAGARSFANGWRILTVVGFVACLAAVVQPLVSPVPAVVNAVIATAAAVGTLRFLLVGAAALPIPGRVAAGRAAPGAGAAVMPDWDRRTFLLRSGALLGGAVVAGGLGRLLVQRAHPAAPPVAVRLPAPAGPPPALPPGSSLDAPGITPLVTPNGRFYRIDTELLVPQVDAATWQLRVDGMVDHPLTFTYDELIGLPLFDQYVTLECVSNVVGGDLIGNALWTGVHLKAILAEAGIRPGATQIVGRAVDGFTVGFPTSWALDPSREPMIVVGMNGSPLPAEHGFPARLIVPGLYGYVSATKWLSEIWLTTMEAFNAYWVNLGWAKEGPILTGSRIDHPADGSSLAAGPQVIDGLAWAPDRGVSRVEVQIDGGPWQAAELARAISRATWVQWELRWAATAGSHSIRVRAVDGTGQVQTGTPGGPAPAGATGYDEVRVTVR